MHGDVGTELTTYATLHISALVPHFAPRITSGQRYCRIWISSVKWCSVHVANNRPQHGWAVTNDNDMPFPRSAILTVILSFPSNILELEVSSPKLWLRLESMDMTEVDNGTSDVAAVEADGAIDVNEGPVFELDTVAPECDSTSSIQLRTFSSLRSG